MTPADFRRLALALAGVAESAHMNYPDFRAGELVGALSQGRKEPYNRRYECSGHED